ncbi:FHA domain-containing protein [Pseudomonas sp. CDFA 602]|uniref:type VI secretion system-associated FHA domain protein n=1 Tax=Pseudomonas californiensis TaxID=2829823 RepID=UPI001E4120BB|nr:type VI secretion system-associated FHA domain protein [Pseudomonas californiensis]MCD5994598.1 FHA domain-containing protein [Pseudomonas californiensis]MCD6000040.1 FHA domain-containing protein [Pseudomonas californiensis]
MELVFEVINPHSLREGRAMSWTCGPGGGVIGRAADCDWRIEDAGQHVSRHHAQITYSQGEYYLTDISRNGTATSQAETLRTGYPQRVRQGSRYQLGDVEIEAYLGAVNRSQSACSLMTESVLQGLGSDELDPLIALQAHAPVCGVMDGLSSFIAGASEPGQGSCYARPEREHLPLPELVACGEPRLPHRMTEVLATQPDLFWNRFGVALGMNVSELDPATREALAERVAGLLKHCVTGLRQGAWTRNELAEEWGGGLSGITADGDDPFETGDTRSTLVTLLLKQPEPRDSERLIAQAFRDAQAHQVAMLAGCRAMTRALLENLSPKQLRLQFGLEANWPVLTTAGRCWRAYQRHHQTLTCQAQQSDGFMAQDFAQAYDEQIRLINTLHSGLPE